MPRPRGPATEMLRLPVDVARALRRRAAAADVTIAEASRQLMQPKELERPLGLLEHAARPHAQGGRADQRRPSTLLPREARRLPRKDEEGTERPAGGGRAPPAASGVSCTADSRAAR